MVLDKSDVAAYSCVEPGDNITQSDSSLWIPEDVFNMQENGTLVTNPQNNSYVVKNQTSSVHMNMQNSRP
jgi:hypothetical protein